MRLVRFSLNLHQQSAYIWVNPEHVAYVRGQTIFMGRDLHALSLQMVGEDDIIAALGGAEPDKRGGWKVVTFDEEPSAEKRNLFELSARDQWAYTLGYAAGHAATPSASDTELLHEAVTYLETFHRAYNGGTDTKELIERLRARISQVQP